MEASWHNREQSFKMDRAFIYEKEQNASKREFVNNYNALNMKPGLIYVILCAKITNCSNVKPYT